MLKRTITTILVTLFLGTAIFPSVSFADQGDDKCSGGSNKETALEIAKLNATSQLVIAFIPEFSKRQKQDNNLDQTEAKYVELIKAVRGALDKK